MTVHKNFTTDWEQFTETLIISWEDYHFFVVLIMQDMRLVTNFYMSHAAVTKPGSYAIAKSQISELKIKYLATASNFLLHECTILGILAFSGK